MRSWGSKITDGGKGGEHGTNKKKDQVKQKSGCKQKGGGKKKLAKKLEGYIQSFQNKKKEKKGGS